MSVGRQDIGELSAVAARTFDESFAIYEADGRTPVGIAADDVVRFKLSSTIDQATPTLDLSTLAATANGSTVTVTSIGTQGSAAATVKVRLGQGDTSALSGRKYWELILIDNSETLPADAAKVICFGTIVFRASQGGSVAIS